MKTISKVQFENAVNTVLNGGKSKMIVTTEVKPFSWSRSKGYNNLKGSVPSNSKFLRNEGRGGKANDVYLVCALASGYSIAPTKKESLQALKKENDKKKLARFKSIEKSAEMKRLAIENGFSSVAELKRRNKEIIEANNNRMALAIKKRNAKFEEVHGYTPNTNKLTDKVKLSNIALEFDSEYIKEIY